MWVYFWTLFYSINQFFYILFTHWYYTVLIMVALCHVLSKCWSSNFLFFFKVILVILGPLHFPMNFILCYLFIISYWLVLFFGGGPYHVACRSLTPWPGWNPCPVQWKYRKLTTGLPGNPLPVNFRSSLSISPNKSPLGSWLCLCQILGSVWGEMTS